MTGPTSSYEFLPSERPSFPGSPFTPRLSLPRRLGYAAIALLVGVTATLGNALVNVNLAAIAGSAGMYVVEASWLPAIYVAFNASANLMLVKARAQFGIPRVVITVLGLYAATAALQLIFPVYLGAVAVRAASGLAAAALTTYTVYHLIEALPPAKRAGALAIGIVIPQLGTPLARMLPVELLTTHQWRGIHLIELATALFCIAATVALPLPPTERSKVFSRLDVLTMGLLLPANVMLCGFLSLGRLLWWVDATQLALLLCGAIVCYVAAYLLERHRRAPLLQMRWITTKDILRFAAVAIFVRLALAEQTYEAVGLLASGGLINDQLAGLFAWVALAMIVGIGVVLVLLSQQRLPYLVMAASLTIAVGAILDSHSNALSRPAQLYASQMLLGLGTALFMGPALLYGLMHMRSQGPNFLVSFVVLFSTTQNIGGLAGSAILGTLQTIQTRVHATSMATHLTSANPAIAAQLHEGAAGFAGVLTDPVARQLAGGRLLGQALNTQAAAAAYDDVFALVAVFALGTALYVGVATWSTRYVRRDRNA
ncbi:MFS transporter [Luteibacter sp. UNCMF366Tsu5.1]|uniref:MFS transporter n=1 Tax=Luteibacter sp. UNCMF366Tsu5.1 TaxID=1502758 RepID=UPI00090884BA|nr:MFS transporter [Luteibacter sp. UNCMF366Tsu5.1]SFW29665.1 hypothetical protein SAMN02800691_0847 [Luteibacter sp. UNCMF366Tsu5.1]